MRTSFLFLLLWVTSTAFPSHWKHKGKRGESTTVENFSTQTEEMITDASTKVSTGDDDTQSIVENTNKGLLEDTSDIVSSSPIDGDSSSTASEDNVSSDETSVDTSDVSDSTNDQVDTNSTFSEDGGNDENSSLDEELTTLKSRESTLNPITSDQVSSTDSGDYNEYEDFVDDENESSEDSLKSSTTVDSTSIAQDEAGDDVDTNSLPPMNNKRSISQLDDVEEDEQQIDDADDDSDNDDAENEQEYRWNSPDKSQLLLRTIKSIRKLGLRRRNKIRNSPKSELTLPNFEPQKSERGTFQNRMMIEDDQNNEEDESDMEGDTVQQESGSLEDSNLDPSMESGFMGSGPSLNLQPSRPDTLALNAVASDKDSLAEDTSGEDNNVVKRYPYALYYGKGRQYSSDDRLTNPLEEETSGKDEQSISIPREITPVQKQQKSVDNAWYENSQKEDMPGDQKFPVLRDSGSISDIQTSTSNSFQQFTNKRQNINRDIESNTINYPDKKMVEESEGRNQASGVTELDAMFLSTAKLPKEAKQITKVVEQEDIDWIHKRNTKKKFGDLANDSSSTGTFDISNFSTSPFPSDFSTDIRVKKNPLPNNDNEDTEDDLEDSEDDVPLLVKQSSVALDSNNSPTTKTDLPKDIGKREDSVDASLDMEPNHASRVDPADLDRPALYGRKFYTGLSNEDTLVNGDEAWNRMYEYEPGKHKDRTVNIKIQIRKTNNQTEKITMARNETFATIPSVVSSLETQSPNLKELVEEIPVLRQSPKVVLELMPKSMTIEFRKSKDNSKLIPVKEVIHFARDTTGLDISGQSQKINSSTVIR